MTRQTKERSWQELLPDAGFEVLRPRRPAAGTPNDPRRALVGAGLEAFAAEAGGRPLTIVVNDAHRFTDTRGFIDAVWELLGSFGPRPRLRLLVATGSHVSSAAERREHEDRVLGERAAGFEEVSWHDARDPDGLCRVGGFEFHRWMGEGGHYLACGSVEPHYFAGVTGAHKTLSVGVMSLASLTDNHRHAMSPRAMALRLDGNPVHEEIARALEALIASGARLLALNQVLSGSRLVACSAGQPLDCARELLGVVRQSYCHRLDSAVDLLVASVDAPLDRDLYQADKGIKNTELAVKDGGVLLLEASCEGGLGLDRFVDLLRSCPEHASALASVEQRGYRLGDHKAVRLRALTDLRGVRVGLVSHGVDASLAEVLGMRIFASREEAVGWLGSLGADRAPRALLAEDAGNLALELAA